MVGETAELAAAVELPSYAAIRRVDQLPEWREFIASVSTMQRAVFGEGPAVEKVVARLDRMGGDEQFWAVEAANTVVYVG